MTPYLGQRVRYTTRDGRTQTGVVSGLKAATAVVRLDSGRTARVSSSKLRAMSGAVPLWKNEHLLRQYTAEELRLAQNIGLSPSVVRKELRAMACET